MAAATAWLGVAKTAHTLSPAVLKTTPPHTSMASRKMRSCRAMAAPIAAGYRSQSRVLPSISVKRKVCIAVRDANGASGACGQIRLHQCMRLPGRCCSTRLYCGEHLARID